MSVPLVVHVVHRFAMGGLENGVVNLVNSLADGRFRHALIALTEAGPFRERLQGDVEIVEMHRKPGNDPRLVLRLHREFRRLRPAIVHTRNIGTLDAVWAAWAAGVPVRVHGEHGWDVDDPRGTNARHRLLRRVARPFITHFVPLSRFQERYLAEQIGVPERRMTRIINGVNCEHFAPGPADTSVLPGGLVESDSIVFGTVGRMHGVKAQTHLADAFAMAGELAPPDLAKRMRLVMVGDGPLRGIAQSRLDAAGLGARSWLPGARDDVVELMHTLDVFVLPSLTEGISNTILEAMACGRPVIATAVGGNAELVDDGVTGKLVPADDVPALAAAMLEYAGDQALRERQGRAARDRATSQFALSGMIERYGALYARLLGR